MKNLLALTGVLALFLAACNTADDEPKLEPLPQPVERFFTLTNGDSQYPFIYMGGMLVYPSEVSQPITLYGDTTDYIIFWGIDGVQYPDTLHIDMTGKPEGVTINYKVRYEK